MKDDCCNMINAIRDLGWRRGNEEFSSNETHDKGSCAIGLLLKRYGWENRFSVNSITEDSCRIVEDVTMSISPSVVNMIVLTALLEWFVKGRVVWNNRS